MIEEIRIAEKEHAITKLREILQPGDILYVSHQGYSDLGGPVFGIYAIANGSLACITKDIAVITERTYLQKFPGIVLNGFWDMTTELSAALFPNETATSLDFKRI